MGSIDRTGCQRRALPAELPPAWTVYGFFRLWRRAGATFHAWHGAVSRPASKRANPRSGTVAVGPQFVRGHAAVGNMTCGYEAGKEIRGPPAKTLDG